ncbi:MAG: aspartyl/asparaginyl beta-hydroxylase domain-containing protein [Chitinophagaceae bacterium]|nr:MAG: aspartyl/asparaginyl beta-hydroxylase domain-containing protein [Chitinophagaceae bacterium]
MNKNTFFYKIIERTGKFILAVFTYLVEKFSKNTTENNPYSIKGLKELEINYEDIYHELEKLLSENEMPGVDEFFTEQKPLVKNKSWRSFLLFIYGNELVDNTNQCPKTTELLKNIHGMSSAMFSVLSAGQSIPPHKGVYKGVYRVLLGLKIPPDSEELCYLQVEDKKMNWEKGKIMLFDDTKLHSAHNYTNQDRVVLFIDVVRPLPFPLNILNFILFYILSNAPYIKEAVYNYKKFGNHKVRKFKIAF